MIKWVCLEMGGHRKDLAILIENMMIFTSSWNGLPYVQTTSFLEPIHIGTCD